MYFAGMKETSNYSACVPCTALAVLITNGKWMLVNWAECTLTLFLQNSLGVLSHLENKINVCMIILLNMMYHYQTFAPFVTLYI